MEGNYECFGGTSFRHLTPEEELEREKIIQGNIKLMEKRREQFLLRKSAPMDMTSTGDHPDYMRMRMALDPSIAEDIEQL
ncbi:MAG: hypothetical protein LBG88_03550 [Christensenellaceae bacterium]|jgi:hypothetical protein|nr:hypothetical protein [Christensenellaceae bacterium]